MKCKKLQLNSNMYLTIVPVNYDTLIKFLQQSQLKVVIRLRFPIFIVLHFCAVSLFKSHCSSILILVQVLEQEPLLLYKKVNIGHANTSTSNCSHRNVGPLHNSLQPTVEKCLNIVYSIYYRDSCKPDQCKS